MTSKFLCSLILLSCFFAQGMEKEEKGKNTSTSISVFPVPGKIEVTDKTTILDLKSILQAKYSTDPEWGTDKQIIRACKYNSLEIEYMSDPLSNSTKVQQVATIYDTTLFMVSSYKK